MEEKLQNPIDSKQVDSFHVVESAPVPPTDTTVFHKNISEQGIFMRATNTVPTDVPDSALDKFRLYVNGTDIRFYVYDTVNGVWRTIGGGGGSGSVTTYNATLSNVSNTIALLPFLSFTVPANDMADGDVIECVFTVNYSNDVGVTNIVLQLDFGGSVATITNTLSSGTTGTPLAHFFKFVMQRVGSQLWYWQPSNDPYEQYAGFEVVGVWGGATANILAPDFTISNTVQFLIQLDPSTASIGLSFEPQKAKIYKIGA